MGQACLVRTLASRDSQARNSSALRRLLGTAALRAIRVLVEQPGVEAVAMGLSLAEAGYRPVLVFNGHSLRPCRGHPSEPAPESPAVVDVESILAAIVQGAERLRNRKIPSTAPPAFVIDQFRSSPSRPLQQGAYDNRSWVYKTDFPSADRFRSEGISRLIVFTDAREPLAMDLEHILRVWDRDGLAVLLQPEWGPGPPEPLRLRRPSWISGVRLWMRGLFSDPVRGRGFFVSVSSG